MEPQELRQKSDKELGELLQEKQHALRELTFQAHEGQLKQVHKIKRTRTIIARIQTILQERYRVAQKDTV